MHVFLKNRSAPKFEHRPHPAPFRGRAPAERMSARRDCLFIFRHSYGVALVAGFQILCII